MTTTATPDTIRIVRQNPQTRKRLLDAAVKVFCERGFHAATKERIAVNAGFSHQTVRDYFRTNEEILAVICTEVWTEVNAAMVGKDPLLAAFDILRDLRHRNPDKFRCVTQETKTAGADGMPLLTNAELDFGGKLTARVMDARGGGSAAMAAERAAILWGAIREPICRETFASLCKWAYSA